MIKAIKYDQKTLSTIISNLKYKKFKNYARSAEKKLEEDFGKGDLFHRNVFPNETLSLEKVELGKG